MTDASLTDDQLAPAHFSQDPVVLVLARLLRGMNPGDKLPTERELAVKLDVSRSALRDRLSILEGLGVLQRRAGSGTYVQDFDSTTVAAALNLGISSTRLPVDGLESVRIALERQAAIEAAHSSDPVLVAYMQRALRDLRRAETVEQRVLADRSFHQALLRAASNPALTFFADAIDGVLNENLSSRFEQAQHLTPPLGSEEFFDAHRRIHDAIVDEDAKAAAQAVDEHFMKLPRYS
jgi:GntR family transcriptional regulator, transcriptional repressor for pyruvate dehydrogenase complex